MFIFDRCCRSSAAVTPVKYECDTNNITGTFAISKILLTEKLTSGALVTPTRDWWASTVVSGKRDFDNIRMSVNLSKRYQYVKREHFPAAPPWEVVANIPSSSARYFTKYDALSGYHKIPLAEESQKFTTTFITPFGRYKFSVPSLGGRPFQITTTVVWLMPYQAFPEYDESHTALLPTMQHGKNMFSMSLTSCSAGLSVGSQAPHLPRTRLTLLVHCAMLWPPVIH